MSDEGSLSLEKMTLEELAGVLSAAGEPVATDELAAYFDTGCPRNPDGTVSFLVFTAWLCREWRGR